MNEMRVLMLEAPTALLEERARHGLDKWDEMWQGVRHCPAVWSMRHQQIRSELILWLHQRRDEEVRVASTCRLHGNSEHDWRVPDLMLLSAKTWAEDDWPRAAQAVFEIHESDDESYEKIPWYLGIGVPEVVIVNRDTLSVEVFRSLDSATGEPVVADDTRVESLDARLERVTDDHLRIHLDDGTVHDIQL